MEPRENWEQVDPAAKNVTSWNNNSTSRAGFTFLPHPKVRSSWFLIECNYSYFGFVQGIMGKADPSFPASFAPTLNTPMVQCAILLDRLQYYFFLSNTWDPQERGSRPSVTLRVQKILNNGRLTSFFLQCFQADRQSRKERKCAHKFNFRLPSSQYIISQNRFLFFHSPFSSLAPDLLCNASLTYGLFFYTVNFHTVLRQCFFITAWSV